jgi:hypothetical protein
MKKFKSQDLPMAFTSVGILLTAAAAVSFVNGIILIESNYKLLCFS